MTDPVRPVAPREDELEALKRAHALLNKHQIDWLTHHGVEQTDEYLAWMAERKNVLRLIENTLRLAAAPVPCAASPADEELAIAMLAACEATIRHLWDIAARFDTKECNLIRDEIHRLNTITLPAIQDLRATGEGARDEQATTIQSEGETFTVTAGTSTRSMASGDGARGLPTDRCVDPQRADAPVAVSLGLPEALAAFIDVYDVVFDEDDVVMLQAVLARLRGEATVRVEE